MNIDPVVLGTAVLAIGSAAVYAYVKGVGTSASVDLDDDGTDEATVEFGGGAETEAKAKPQTAGVPSHVAEVDSLTDIKGVQETRAENLREAGFDTPADVYFASDENLEAVHQLGPTSVQQIREDIGGIDYEGNDATDDDSEA
jgi:predicted flap endonuclease-1-like 5' DNA nuclease